MADITEGLDPDFLSKLEALINASGGKIWINSGYRSDERQAQLFAAAVQKYGSEEAARKWVAPPGKSNHNHGLAADLGGDLELAHQLAPQFGLVFPMSWEAWHIEPPSAREKRGADYGSSQTVPPDGVTPDNTGYGTLQSQLDVFQRILKGEDVSGMGATDGTSGAGAGGESSQGTGAEAPASAAALYSALVGQGVDPVHAAALVAIAGRESSYDPSAHNGNHATGDDSYGLFQINLLGGQHSQFTPEQLSTFDGSVAAGAELVKSSGLQPWGGYKGMSWAEGTNLEAAVAASGGQVTLDQLKAIENEGLK